MNPTGKGLWLVYASFQKDSLIDIGMCGPSVSLSNPSLYYPPPIVFGDRSEHSELKWEIEILHKKIDGVTDWYNDLYRLREYRQEHLKNDSSARPDFKMIVLICSLILNIFMFIMVIRKYVWNR